MLYAPQRVEHGAAGGPAAQHRFVLDGRQVGPLAQGREQGGQRHHHARGLQPAGRPHVPAEAHAVALLVLTDELREGRHDNRGGGVSVCGGREGGGGGGR